MKERLKKFWLKWAALFVLGGAALSIAGLVIIIGVKSSGGGKNADYLTQHLIYEQDEKTGLCFAHGETGGLFGGHTLTNVPCTEAVLKEISTAKE